MNGLRTITKLNQTNLPKPTACESWEEEEVTSDDATNFDIVAILAVATIWLAAVLFSIGAFH